ncbi:tumor necrosis factor ligand superfamily member 15-like isoform X2 [Cetorhinus maximus]
MKPDCFRCFRLNCLCAALLLVASLTFLILKKQNSAGFLLEDEEVEGSVLKGTKSSDGRLRYMEWETEKDLAFIKNGFIYQNGSLIVPVTGQYFVYSQVYLRAKNCVESNTFIRHTINKRIRTDLAPMTLISKTVQCQPNIGDFWFQTNYVGGKFTLNKGDELFANISDLALLGNDENQTFFGALLL